MANGSNDVTTMLATLRATLVGATGQVDGLAALLNAQPPPQPPPPPPPNKRASIYVSGDTLYGTDGTPMPPFASIELMIGSGRTGPEVATYLDTCKALGATAVGPLFEGAPPTPGYIDTLLRLCENRGLLCLLNADHSGGRNWLLRPDIAAVINTHAWVILQCEVEQGAGVSAESWRDAAIAYVKAMRAVYPIKPLRVGLPDGGRNVGPALKYATAVRDADPGMGGLMFAPQMYWSTRTSWYQGLGGFAAGSAGEMAAVKRIAAADGVYMFAGVDKTDDVGDTGEDAIMAEQIADGVSTQVWVLNNDNANQLVNDPADATTITSVGSAVSKRLKAYPRLVLS